MHTTNGAGPSDATGGLLGAIAIVTEERRGEATSRSGVVVHVADSQGGYAFATLCMPDGTLESHELKHLVIDIDAGGALAERVVRLNEELGFLAKGDVVDTVGPLWRTDLTIWSDFDASQVEISTLAREAESGDAYCSYQRRSRVEVPERDPRFDGS